MDRIFAFCGQQDNSVRPEIIVAYVGVGILVSLFVNWALAALLCLLKPFTCAAILMAFIRPDLAQNLMKDDCMMRLVEKSKVLFVGLTNIVLRLGEQFHDKFN
ncbi:hypothetical protein RUM43_011071 [Polyplax serrata]|uniref:Uncharacterized protein n=1 Tax=Polyplax serrata TaxID=468196 RepID=A0AAN8S7P4_POLSC